MTEGRAVKTPSSDNSENGTNWNNGEWLFPKAVKLLEIPDYRKTILTGLVLSVSTRTNSTVRCRSIDAVPHFIDSLIASNDLRHRA